MLEEDIMGSRHLLLRVILANEDEVAFWGGFGWCGRNVHLGALYWPCFV